MERTDEVPIGKWSRWEFARIVRHGGRTLILTLAEAFVIHFFIIHSVTTTEWAQVEGAGYSDLGSVSRNDTRRKTINSNKQINGGFNPHSILVDYSCPAVCNDQADYVIIGQYPLLVNSWESATATTSNKSSLHIAEKVHRFLLKLDVPKLILKRLVKESELPHVPLNAHNSFLVQFFLPLLHSRSWFRAIHTLRSLFSFSSVQWSIDVVRWSGTLIERTYRNGASHETDRVLLGSSVVRALLATFLTSFIVRPYI